MRKRRFKEALSHAQVKEDRTGVKVLGIGFPIPHLAYCSPWLSLSTLLSWFLQNDSSRRNPTSCLFRTWALVKEDVEFWVQRGRLPAASDTPTHPWAVNSCQCLPDNKLSGAALHTERVSLTAPKTDFAISSSHLQSQVGFL